jgi:hypothetical protein
VKKQSAHGTCTFNKSNVDKEDDLHCFVSDKLTLTVGNHIYGIVYGAYNVDYVLRHGKTYTIGLIIQ